MKIYSEKYYTCPYCFKRYKGIISKGGDGSTYVFPNHNVYRVFRDYTYKVEKILCRGSHEEVKDED